MNPSKTKVVLVKKVKGFRELTWTLTLHQSIVPAIPMLESLGSSELAGQQYLKAFCFIFKLDVSQRCLTQRVVRYWNVQAREVVDGQAGWGFEQSSGRYPCPWHCGGETR